MTEFREQILDSSKTMVSCMKSVTTAPSAPYLPDVISNSIAYPLHPSSAKSTVPAGRSVATASNGAFVLVGNTPGGAITLRKNRHYHGAAGVRIDEVRYFPIADESTEFTRFRAGELDMTNTVPAPRVSELRASRTAMLQMRPLLATFFYSFNLERGPLSRSPELREALSLVVDREGITEKIAKAGPGSGLCTTVEQNGTFGGINLS